MAHRARRGLDLGINADQENTELKTPEQIGQLLCATILRVFESIPDCSMRPTDISKKLGVSRTMVSRTISAVGKDNPIETLTSLPGPESLRTIIHAAKVAGATEEGVQEALLSISLLADMIQYQYGTRAAFNADLSVQNDDAKNRYEQASRYQIFKGMSQMLGVQCKVWVSCTVFSPSKVDESMLGRSHLTGGAGLRRLRSDMPVRLAIGNAPHPRRSFKLKDVNVSSPNHGHIPIDMEPFYENPPAMTEIVDEKDRVIQIFSPPVQDKDTVYDLISALHIPDATSKQGWPKLKRRGIATVPDVPTSVLNIDIVLHKDIFVGIDPEAFVYNVGIYGPASFREGNWETNRVETDGKITELGFGLENIEIEEVPKYTEMVHCVCAEAGYDPSEFRVYRWRIQYPVFGFQYMLAFPVLKPEGE